MEDFYKIKPGMDKQHAEHLKRLGEIYHSSLKEHQKEEKEIQDKIDSKVKELEDANKKLKVAKEDEEKSRQENVRLVADNVRLVKVKMDFEAYKKLTEDGFKKDREKIAYDREELDKEEKDTYVRLSVKEDQIKQLSIDANAILTKNVSVVANIKSEQENLNKIRLDIGKSSADLKLAQDNHSGYVSKYNDDKHTLEAQQIVQEAEKKKINEDKVAITNRENTATTRENLVKQRENKVEEREIAADLRNIELNKKEKRIKDLQAIYEASLK